MPIRTPPRLQVRALLRAAAVLALAACGGKQAEPVAPSVVRLFPPPPDTARIQFLTRISTRSDVVGEHSPNLFQRIVGEQRDDVERLIVKPYGIALHQGTIYVCDGVLPGLEVIDLEAPDFRYVKPTGMGRLPKPINCFTDGQGRLYVTDVGRGEVVVFGDSLAYLGVVGGDSLRRPGDVFVSEERIWITDVRSARVRVYDGSTWEHLYSFPSVAPTDADAPERLIAPANLFVTDDRVYVSDMYAAKVQVYTHDGDYVGSVGSYGLQLGQFYRPKGIAVDRDGILYVADAGFDNVQMFNPEGQLLMAFGGHYEQPGDMMLPAKVVLDYDNLEYFQQYVDPRFDLKYLILVTNQYGPDKINVYGFVEQRDPGLNPR